MLKPGDGPSLVFRDHPIAIRAVAHGSRELIFKHHDIPDSRSNYAARGTSSAMRMARKRQSTPPDLEEHPHEFTLPSTVCDIHRSAVTRSPTSPAGRGTTDIPTAVLNRHRPTRLLTPRRALRWRLWNVMAGYVPQVVESSSVHAGIRGNGLVAGGDGSPRHQPHPRCSRGTSSTVAGNSSSCETARSSAPPTIRHIY